METNRKIMTLTATVLLGLLLGACSDTANNSTAPQSTTTPATTTEPTSPETNSGTGDAPATSEGTDTPASTDNESSTSSGTAGSMDNRPESQSFELMATGELKKYPATLKKGSSYSLYVFDGFTFDSSANQLMLTDKPKNTATIEPLPADFNLDELRKQGKAELQKYGEVKEYSGDQLAESPMSQARLLLQVSNEKGTYNYIVWEPEGENGYIFHTIIPESEDAGTIGLQLSTSLSTVKAE
ncbi:hypothetical protein [Paenibacillus sp. WLX2291]|uniref:hypothetical protein n=1 Tax=Paenibacillus sp. WLX2291 TaxID=3296934 RepID=UPI00398440F6